MYSLCHYCGQLLVQKTVLDALQIFCAFYDIHCYKSAGTTAVEWQLQDRYRIVLRRGVSKKLYVQILNKKIRRSLRMFDFLKII